MAKSEDFPDIHAKVVSYISNAFDKYEKLAESIKTAKEKLTMHEHMCYAQDMHECVKKHDEFNATVFPRERSIAKLLRSCVNSCREKVPNLLQLGSYTPSSLAELRAYEEGSKCFSQCVDTVSPDFTKIETSIYDSYTKLNTDYPVD